MAFQDVFSSRASTYTKFRPDYPAELIAFVASLAPARRLAWDCGTGNGQAAVALAPYFDCVIATDASAQQLEHARPHDRVEYRVATAESSGLESYSADLVTVAQALHWFDRDAFYAEVRRVLVPRGAIAVWTYGDPVLDDPAADAVLQRFNFETMGKWWPVERGAVGAAYRELPFPFAEVEAPSYTLERTWTAEELIGYCSSWSAVARYRAVNLDDPMASFAEELARQWGGAGVRHRIRWPLTVRAGHVTE